MNVSNMYKVSTSVEKQTPVLSLGEKENAERVFAFPLANKVTICIVWM